MLDMPEFLFTGGPNGWVGPVQIGQRAFVDAVAPKAPTQKSVIIRIPQRMHERCGIRCLLGHCGVDGSFDTTETFLIARVDFITLVQFQDFDGLFTLGGGPAMGIDQREKNSGRGAEIEELPWVIRGRVQQGRRAMVQGELGSLAISAATGTAKEHVRPGEHAVRVNGFRPEMLDVGSGGIGAIHATLAAAGHLFQRGSDGPDLLCLGCAFPRFVHIEIARSFGGVGALLSTVEVTDDISRQSGTSDTSHGSKVFPGVDE